MREGEFRIPGGCAIAAVIHKDKQRENGVLIKKAMATMHDRSNGLGGGFVGYGIYPQHQDEYALHLFYDDLATKIKTEALIEEIFQVSEAEEIPRDSSIKLSHVPLIWRYFVQAKTGKDEKEQIVSFLFLVNTKIKGAYVFSCGKNMGIFKGIGYPEELADFYRLQDMEAYTWIAHGRYPTNSPGWCAGAHPFGMLDMALVHNGEISSYDANRRYIEMFGYPCSLLTDTEVITYLFDFLMRRSPLTFEECAHVLAAPFWDEIKWMEPEEKRYYTMLRRNLGSMLITGPFSIILGFDDGVGAMNDRLKLRSLMIGEKDNTVWMASEESAIRSMEPDLDTLFSLDGGVGYVVRYQPRRKDDEKTTKI